MVQYREQRQFDAEAFGRAYQNGRDRGLREGFESGVFAAELREPLDKVLADWEFIQAYL